MGFALRLVAIALLLGAVALVGMTTLRTQAMMSEPAGRYAAAAEGYLLLALSALGIVLAILVLVALILRAVRFVLDRVGGAEAAGRASPIQRLVALALAVALFPQTASAIWSIAVRLAMELFLEAPRAIAGVLVDGMGCIANAKSEAWGMPAAEMDLIEPCFAYIVGGGVTALSAAVNGIVYRSGLPGLDAASLVFAAATFALTSIGLAWASRQMTDRSRFWVGYAGVAVLSIYLALSATLAVELMRDGAGAQTAATEEQLRARLTAFAKLSEAAPTDEGGPAPAPQPPPARAEAPPRTAVAPDASAGPAPGEAAPPPENRDLAEARSMRTEIATMRAEVAGRIEDLRARTPGALDAMIESAVDLYRTETQIRLGAREASRHYLDITGWFRAAVEARNRLFADCERALAAIDRSAKTAEDAVRDLARPTGPSMDAAGPSWILSDVYAAMQRAAEAQGECRRFADVSSTPPARRVYGSSLGPVGAATQWLLAAESMPVTLITGLVGFGLLGALASRFVRPAARDAVAPAAETAGDIAVVVFSGFAAALVVYVAAYGGIAIAAEDGGNPNPYVVFGACLVGAVFSTDVWEKARERFLEARDGGEGGGGGADA